MATGVAYIQGNAISAAFIKSFLPRLGSPPFSYVPKVTEQNGFTLPYKTHLRETRNWSK